MKLVIANLFNKITEQLWYDAKSDSTLHRYDWRAHHNGIALILMIVLSTYLPPVYSVIGIMLVFSIYKLFFQGNIKDKTAKDFKDFVADFTDYLVIALLLVYQNKLLLPFVLIILIIMYLLTITWSKP